MIEAKIEGMPVLAKVCALRSTRLPRPKCMGRLFKRGTMTTRCAYSPIVERKGKPEEKGLKAESVRTTAAPLDARDAVCNVLSDLAMKTESFVCSALPRKLGNRVSNLMRSKYDTKIMDLAGPALLTLAADPLLSMVDTAFVGQLGSNELAALGVNTAIYSMAFVVFNFLATATTPIIASALSTNDKEKAGQVTFQAFLLSGILGVGLMCGLMGFSDGALESMGATGEVAVIGKEYLLSRAIAAPAAVWCLAGLGVFRGLQDMRTPLLVTFAANALNLLLDPIFIYGLGMGVKGAALSTSLAECGSAVAYTIILWRDHRDSLGLNCSVQTAIKRAQADYLPFLSAGGTLLVRTTVLLATKTLASSTATHLGPVSISAHQVVAQLWLLFSLMTDSLAVSGQSLVAVYLGKNDSHAARQMSDRLIELGIGLGVLTAIFFTAISPYFPHLFTNDPAILDQVHSIMPLAIAVLPINSLAYVLDGVLIGAEDFSFLAWSMAPTALIVSSGLLMVEPFNWGIEGVWACQALLMMLRAGTLSFRYNMNNGPVPPPEQCKLLGEPNARIDA